MDWTTLSAWIKKPFWPFWILQAVWQWRRSASTPFAAKVAPKSQKTIFLYLLKIPCQGIVIFPKRTVTFHHKDGLSPTIQIKFSHLPKDGLVPYSPQDVGTSSQRSSGLLSLYNAWGVLCMCIVTAIVSFDWPGDVVAQCQLHQNASHYKSKQKAEN